MLRNDYATYQVKDFVLDDAFTRWVKQPDAESNAFWQDWMAAHPEKVPTVQEARQVILQLRFNADELGEAGYRRIQARLDAVYESTLSQASVRRTEPKRRLGDWITLRVAAALALLLVAGFTLWFTLLRNPAPETYATAYGETRTIWLPDSSRVVLNANSSLRYNSRWNETEAREVWLSGEAYFIVRKKAGLPEGSSSSAARFIVRTDQANIEVLGTQFNVHNRRGNTTVVLSEGKVQLAARVADTSEPLLMEPGEYVQVSDQRRQITRKRVNPENYSSWTENKLVFDDTSLREIARLLEDTYGYPVVFADAGLADRTFTATIPTHNLDTLLLALSEAFNITITRKANQLIVANNK